MYALLKNFEKFDEIKPAEREAPLVLTNGEAAGGAESLTFPQIPTIRDPSASSHLRCQPALQDYVPEAFPDTTGELYCPHCLQSKEPFFMDACQEHSISLF